MKQVATPFAAKRADARSGRGTRSSLIDQFASPQARSIMLLIITIAVAMAAIASARQVLAPVCFALVIGVVVSPLADKLNQWHIPRIAIAGALLLFTCGVLILGFLVLEPLLTNMATRLPEIRAEIESWLENISGLIRGIETLSAEVENAVGSDMEKPAAPELPTVMDALWLAPGLGASMLIFVGTLFFFVLTRADLYNAAGRFSDGLFKADRAVSRYFLAVTIVNIALGVSTALVMTLLGVNSALLWGLAAGVLNYILYLGPMTIIFSLLVAGIIQFAGAMSFLPAFAYLCLNILESQFITPTFVGQRLHINPLAVFLAIVLGLWIWGPIGAIVALPISLWLAVFLQTPLVPGRER